MFENQITIPKYSRPKEHLLAGNYVQIGGGGLGKKVRRVGQRDSANLKPKNRGRERESRNGSTEKKKIAGG